MKKKKRGEYSGMHRWSIIRAICTGFFVLPVLYSLFLRPEYSLFDEPLNSATVFLPLLLYSYNANLLAFSIMTIAIAFSVWISRNMEGKEGIAVSVSVGLPIFLCGCCLSSTYNQKEEFNFLNWGVNLEQQDTITANDHVYHLLLSRARMGYGGGYILECDQTGLFCRAVHAEPWSTEAHFNRNPPQMYLEYEADSIKIMVGQELLGETTVESAVSNS